MGVFITSRSAATRHAVYAEERQSPAIIQATGTGVAGLVGQFPWGPDNEVITPTDPADRGLILAPFGMARTGSGWLATLQKGWPDLRIVRVLGSAAAKASAALLDGATEIVIVPARYKGTAGNSIICIVTDAADGDANHFNLEVAVSGANGTTSDLYENLNYSGVGTESPPVDVGPRLTGILVKVADGRPTNSIYTMTGGLDGTINSARYTGTAGGGDFGVALFENDLEVRSVFSDDPGNSIRVAVNAALASHATLMGDRLAVLNGDSGLATAAAVVTAAGANRSKRVVWVDPWVYVFDDTDGTERLVPPNSFAASVMAQLSPSTSPAWKDGRVGEMLQGINRLETPRGQSVSVLTTGGVMGLTKETSGGYRFEAGVLTIRPADPRSKNITRTRIGDYIATSITSSLRGSVDAPNVPLNQQSIIQAVSGFLEGMVSAVNSDPNNLPHILAFQILPLDSANPQASLDAGDFVIPVKVKTSSAMERIFLSIEYGESVTVTAS
jgi:hypothetical protein